MIADPTVTQGKYGKGQHPNSQENLKKGRWKKGQSGNPSGHAGLRLHLWTHIKVYALMPVDELKALDPKTLSMVQLTARDYVLKMTKGDWQRIKEALDRDEGKVTERLEVDQETRVTVERL
tara:strand:- start:101 stop:463 length:363 start_codon:yes stop_codon:yes gene_type:complete